MTVISASGRVASVRSTKLPPMNPAPGDRACAFETLSRPLLSGPRVPMAGPVMPLRWPSCVESFWQVERIAAAPDHAGVSKQLIPVYDKPMIYYPLSTLMLAGIRDILIITTPHDESAFRYLLGTGEQFGINLSYGAAVARRPGATFIRRRPSATSRWHSDPGDNIFYGPGLGSRLRGFDGIDGGAIFAYWVADPGAYGVVDFDEHRVARSLEEKPQRPKSNYAVPGCTFTTTRWSISREPQAQRARRIRIRYQLVLPGTAKAVRQGVAAGYRLARHRHVRFDARRR